MAFWVHTCSVLEYHVSKLQIAQCLRNPFASDQHSLAPNPSMSSYTVIPSLVQEGLFPNQKPNPIKKAPIQSTGTQMGEDMGRMKEVTGQSQ